MVPPPEQKEISERARAREAFASRILSRRASHGRRAGGPLLGQAECCLAGCLRVPCDLAGFMASACGAGGLNVTIFRLTLCLFDGNSAHHAVPIMVGAAQIVGAGAVRRQEKVFR